MNERPINYTREAFLHPWNLTFLIAALGVALGVSFSGSPSWLFETALLFTTALELFYLGIMPRQERFRRAVRARRAAEHARPPSQRELFQLLSRTSQRRYVRLRNLQQQIQSNYQKLSYASQGLLESHLHKIENLLRSYLNLLYQKERYEQYLGNTSEDRLAEAIQLLQQDMADDAPRVRSIKERRKRILEQRLERIKKARENLEIIEAQLDTIDDVIQYIHEQSLTLRNPEEITFQLDTLLSEVEETESTVAQIEDIFTSPMALAGEPEPLALTSSRLESEVPKTAEQSASEPLRRQRLRS